MKPRAPGDRRRGWKHHRKELRRHVRNRLARVCSCGEMYGKHGAAPPHTIGDSCGGVVEQGATQ